MKRKLALGIGLLGGTLLALSLAIFGVGAASVLTPVLADPVPARAATTPPHAASEAMPSPSGDPIATDADASVDPMQSEVFLAMPAEEQANGREWMETHAIVADCMQDKGYAYTFEAFWEREPGTYAVPWENSLPVDERAAASLALDGDTGGAADYRWEDAGCYGFAVHVMGNDNNN